MAEPKMAKYNKAPMELKVILKSDNLSRVKPVIKRKTVPIAICRVAATTASTSFRFFLIRTVERAEQMELAVAASIPKEFFGKPECRFSEKIITIPKKPKISPKILQNPKFSFFKRKKANKATKNGKVEKRIAINPEEIYCSPQ